MIRRCAIFAVLAALACSNKQDELIRTLDDYTKRICECEDSPCANRAMTELSDWASSVKPEPKFGDFSPSQQSRLMKVSVRMMECGKRHKLAGNGTAALFAEQPPAGDPDKLSGDTEKVVVFAREGVQILADRACACADTDCGDAVAEAYQAWAEDFRSRTKRLGLGAEESLELSDKVKGVTSVNTGRIYQCLEKVGVEGELIRRLGRVTGTLARDAGVEP